MKKFCLKVVFAIALVFLLEPCARSENLGFFGLNLNTDLYGTLDKAIDEGFRIKIYGSNLNPDYATKLLRLAYRYEVANVDNQIKQFENELSCYSIITNMGEIKYAKGFTVYNFLNQNGEKIGNFIYDDNINFIKKNNYGLNIIPVKLYKENVTIDMIFYNISKNDNYMPLFFGVSFFKLESVQIAIQKLNQRFGEFKNIKGNVIAARYWSKDGVSVANYFGLNDRFVFYDINTIKEFNKIEKEIIMQASSNADMQQRKKQEIELDNLHKKM